MTRNQKLRQLVLLIESDNRNIRMLSASRRRHYATARDLGADVKALRALIQERASGKKATDRHRAKVRALRRAIDSGRQPIR